jgi:hypothetical protein
VHPARHAAVSRSVRQNDFAHEQVGQFVDHQRVELGIAVTEWEHNATSAWLRRRQSRVSAC